MAIKYQARDGVLLWIENPFNGVISYVVDVRSKSFAFTLGARAARDPDETPARRLTDEEFAMARAACPFCPGNEDRSPPEIFRIAKDEIAVPSVDGISSWIVRGFNNLFPRVPENLTGGRNESYVVVEDPRHFLDNAKSLSDLLYTGALGEEHFYHVIAADARVTARALANPAIRSVVVRKNQGRESGASQPHVHQQIIGAPVALPAIAVEAAASRENSSLWDELTELIRELGLEIENRNGVVTYASPIGAFPRSYDIVMPSFRGFINELEVDRLRQFARALHRIARLLGPLPFDYEIHQGEGLPLHAHVNARLYPYSNVAGTLNLPSTLLDNVAGIRRMFAR